jgi:AraC-like DNA-binding protein
LTKLFPLSACCRRDLADPALRHRPITDIAFAAGFNDLSHFSRAYRERYGCAPSDARQIAEPPEVIRP